MELYTVCVTVYTDYGKEPVVFYVKAFYPGQITKALMAGETVTEMAEANGYAVSYTFNPAHIVSIEEFDADTI